MKITPFKELFVGHQKEFSSIIIHTGGHSQTEPGHTWGPGIRTYYLLHYVVKGKGWFETNDQHYNLQKGDLFLGYPNKIIKYCSDLNDPWEYCWVGFSGPDIPRILSGSDFSQKNPIMHIESSELSDILIDIYKSYGHSLSDYLYIMSKLMLFFSLLIKNSKQNKQVSRQTYYLDRAISYIEKECANSPSIEDIADYTGISANYLYRLFMDKYGISPVKYQTQFRIRKACDILLENPGMPINVIAHSVGYQDSLYFTKVFRKITGISPMKYRQIK